MAQLLDWLALTGARDSNGAAVSSGTVWFYEPGGGTSPATVYADPDGDVIAPNPTALDAGGRATVYVEDPVRVVVQDVNGVTITDVDLADVTRAETVQVDNPGWSGGYLDDILTALAASTGGIDGQYQESGGATARTIQSKFEELSISVKDFGAKGDGLTVDTVSIQAAINRVSFLGGGEVYFPPGTYLIDQTLTLTNVTGVALRGAGISASVIKNTSGINTAIRYHFAPQNCSISNLSITATTASSGIGIDLQTSQGMTISQVSVDGHYVAASSTGSGVTFIGVSLAAPAVGAAAARGLVLDTATGVNMFACGMSVQGAVGGFGLDCKNGTLGFAAVGCGFDNINFDATLTGHDFVFSANCTASSITFAAATMPSGYRFDNRRGGSGVSGAKLPLTTGATVTPLLQVGSNFTIECTTTGSASTVAVPSPPPAADDYGVFMTVMFWCHAGGAITAGSGFASGYRISSQPSLIDTHKTTFLFRWDPDNSMWREVSRSDTT